MGEKIHLTYPSTHTPDEIRALLSSYREQFPERYATWRGLEEHGNVLGEDDLLEIQRHGIEFLINNTDCDSRMAASSAWFDMRLEIIRHDCSQ